MRISERQFGTASILDLHGPFIGQQAHDELARAIEPHLQAGREVIVINLTKVPDADDDALYALAKADRALRRSRGTLRAESGGQGSSPSPLSPARGIKI